MSSAILQGGASGSGSLTLLAPNTNSNQVLTLPDSTGTVMATGSIPAFSVYVSNSQGIPTGTETTVQFTTKTFDTGNIYSTSTYRVTPNVAGYYQFNFTLSYNNNAVGSEDAALYKNGSKLLAFWSVTTTSNFYGLSASQLVYANGTTDYFYITISQTEGEVRPLTTGTIWSGFLARAA